MAILKAGQFSARELAAQLPGKYRLFFLGLEDSIRQGIIDQLTLTSSIVSAGMELEDILDEQKESIDAARHARVARAMMTSQPKPEKVKLTPPALRPEGTRQKSFIVKRQSGKRVPAKTVAQPVHQPRPGFKYKKDPNAGAKFAAYRKAVDAEQKQKAEEEAEAQAAVKKKPSDLRNEEIYTTYWDDSMSQRYSSFSIPMDKYVRLAEQGLLEHQMKGTPCPDKLLKLNPRLIALELGMTFNPKKPFEWP